MSAETIKSYQMRLCKKEKKAYALCDRREVRALSDADQQETELYTAEQENHIANNKLLEPSS